MINSLTVTNPLGESIEMELRNPENSGFLILDIDGLGPTKAHINMTDIANVDGAIYNSSQLTPRNILLNLGFMDQPSIQEIRRRSYKYFPIKQKIDILISTDTRDQVTTGYVESNEPSIFGKDDEHANISIVCPDPYFYAPSNTITRFSNVVNNFQFPFSNESLVTNLIDFGEISNTDEVVIDYNGDAEVGLIVYMHSLGAVVNPIFYNSQTSQQIKIDTTKLAAITGSGIIAGDDIVINTLKGQKSISLIRGGITTNIINAVDRNITWLSLFYGFNNFKFYADSGKENLQVVIENPTLYQGV